MEFVNRETLVEKIDFPVLIQSEECLKLVSRPKDFLWDTKKLYDIGTYRNAIITDVNGKQFKFLETRLHKVRLKNIFDIFNFISFSKKYWPYKISAKVSAYEQIEFSKFRTSLMDFIIKNKWVNSPDPAFSEKDRTEIIEKANNTSRFSELFEIVQHSMSSKYLNALFDD